MRSAITRSARRPTTDVAWLAIDPGWRWTAIVQRDGSQLIAHEVIDREVIDPGSTQVSEAYTDAIATRVDQWVRRDPATGLAMEDVTDPVGYEFVTPGHLIGLGIAVGALRQRYRGILLVRPGKHGRRPLVSYPEALVTPGERQHAARKATWGRDAPQNSVLRHARSAWDVAGAAPTYDRIRAALASNNPSRGGPK